MVICAKEEEEKRLFICALWAFWLFNSYQAHLFQLQSGWCRWYDVVPYRQESFKLISSRQSRLPRCFNEYRPSCFSLHHLAQKDYPVVSAPSEETPAISVFHCQSPSPARESIVLQRWEATQGFQPRLLDREESGTPESCVLGKFSLWQKPVWISVRPVQRLDFNLFGLMAQIGDFPLWNSDGGSRGLACTGNEFQKNVSACCLSFRVKGSECVCSSQQVYSRRRFSNHGVPAAWAQGLPRKTNSNIANYYHNYYMMIMVIMKCFCIRRRERSSHCERSSMSCVSFVRVILSTSLPRWVFLESHFGWKEFIIWLVYLIFTHAHVPSAFRF